MPYLFLCNSFWHCFVVSPSVNCEAVNVFFFLTLIIHSLCERLSLSFTACCGVCWQWRWFQQLSCTSSVAGSSLQLCRAAAGWHSSGTMSSLSGSLTSWRDHHDLRWPSLSFIHTSLTYAEMSCWCSEKTESHLWWKYHAPTIVFHTWYHRRLCTIKRLYFGESSKACKEHVMVIWYVSDSVLSHPLLSQFQLLPSMQWFILILDNLGYNADEF